MNGRGKKRWTAGLKTYNQQPAIKELILLILYGGAAEWNSSFHPIQLKQKVKLFILIEWNESWRVSWNEIKMYYNSNLYEADSYLVIIIECFCEEWTNTWNWLRGELVASYKASAHQSHQNQFNSSLPNGKNWLIWLIAGWLAPSVCRAEEKWDWWMKMKSIDLFFGEAWSAEDNGSGVCFSFSFLWGVMGGATRQCSAKRREQKEKTNGMSFHLSFSLLLKKRNKSKEKEESGLAALFLGWLWAAASRTATSQQQRRAAHNNKLN